MNFLESKDLIFFFDPKMESIKSDDMVIKSDDFYVGKPRLKNVCGATQKLFILKMLLQQNLFT